MQIDVTQADIDMANADRSRAYYMPTRGCPVALAAIRAEPRLERIGRVSAYFRQSASEQTIPLPALVTEWIDKFDYRHPVAPFSFTLDMPETA